MARLSGWLTHAKPLPRNVMLVQLGPSLSTTSGSSVDFSTSSAGESGARCSTPEILAPGTDNAVRAAVASSYPTSRSSHVESGRALRDPRLRASEADRLLHRAVRVE